ncbi:hypothetical protein CBL_08619 [Carabus blaptoides fortunei]
MRKKIKNKNEEEGHLSSAIENENTTENTEIPSTSTDITPPQCKGSRRKFLKSWLDKYSWLEYDSNIDRAFCNVCKNVESPKTNNSAFTKDGFNCWKKSTERFDIHEISEIHRKNACIKSNSEKGVNIVSQISESYKISMLAARNALNKIITTILFLSKQGFALRGHTDETASLNELLKLRCEDVPELKSWLNRTSYKWISHDICNEILGMLSYEVTEIIINRIKMNVYYAILIDETSDITVQEQISLCIRTVDKETLDIDEYFFGFYKTEKTDGGTLFIIVKDMLQRLDLPLNNLRGQCFGGASNVSDIHSGLQTKIREIESRDPITLFLDNHLYLVELRF